MVFAISQDEARHLLTRTGFGASMDEIKVYSMLNYEQAVDQLLNQVNSDVVVSPPSWLFDSPNIDRIRMKDLSAEQRKAFRREQRMKGFELKGWWVTEMANTESPLTEKMVLFWHNHFTSSLQKVKQPILLYRQNELFRKHALGNYKTLAHAISKDPAMLRYLDNFKSSKISPNENFARELLELFTLGEENYLESDIKEAARAFTGWSIDRKTGKYVFRKHMHDFGEKEFLAKRGQLDGNDIIEIIFQQPGAAILLVNKLWLEFVSVSPDKAEIDRLAVIFRTNHYEIKPLMRELLMSKAFRDRANYAQLIKSPLDYVVGTLKVLNVPVEDGRIAAFASAQLGQNVFDPPNVKGWSGGETWITSSSLLARQQLLERMFRGNAAESTKRQKKMDRRLNMRKMFSRQNQKVDLRPYLKSLSEKYSKQAILKLLLADEPVDSSLTYYSMSTFNTEELLSLMSDPVYQLK
jgi:uncharacterized protein (DUF1800 family)